MTMPLETIGTIIFISILLIFGGYIVVDQVLLQRGIDFTERIRSLFLGFFLILLSIGITYYDYNEASELFELAHNGKETVGRVVETKTEISYGRKSVSYLNTIFYDGHKLVFYLDREYPLGTNFNLVYVKSNPEKVIFSTMKQGFFNFLISRYTWWQIAIFVSLPLVLLFWGVVSIKKGSSKTKINDFEQTMATITTRDQKPTINGQSLVSKVVRSILFKKITSWHRVMNMNVKAKTFVAVSITLILFLTIIGPWHIKEALDPVDYWTKKRDESQEMVTFYRNEMRSCLLDLEKVKRTRALSMQQSVLAGRTLREASDELLIAFSVQREICSAMRELLNEEQAYLARANQELAKHK